MLVNSAGGITAKKKLSSEPISATVSVPDPPSMSANVGPVRRIVSLPAPPWNASAPPVPMSVSLPWPPTKVSAESVPASVSAADVPAKTTEPEKLPPKMT